MKKLATTLLYAACIAAVPSAAFAQAIEGAPEGYKLVWQDDFTGNALNEKAWNIEVSGTGGGNQELQYYRRENVSVENGNLVLTARREDYQGKKFTSGRINSNNKAAFRHGVLQAKIKFPKTANGLWPAYWMMGDDIDRYGWPRCGEMDIIEMGHFNAISGAYAGWQDRYFSGTLHFGPDATNENHQQVSQEFDRDKFEAMTPIQNDEYHIFTVIWDDDYLYMYYDLEKYTNAKKRLALYFTQPITYSDEKLSAGHYFQKPFYFLFNLAVGGTYTNIYDPAAITALPNEGDEAKMYVDWVRVYQSDDDANSQYLFFNDDGEKVTNIEEEPEKEPEEDNKTELSGFATAAIVDGASTFDFDDAEDVVLISTSQGVTGNFQSRNAVLKDYNVDEVNNFLYIWDGTYVAQSRDGKDNSFGWGEGYNTYYVASAGWSGLGFASPNGKGKDLTMLDDSYWLHFAMKAGDLDQHATHTILIGDAKFLIGNNNGTEATIGDFKRNGEWYYFDIPLKTIREFADPIFPASQVAAYEGNVFAIMSGGVTDTEMTFDNVFFYKSKSKGTPSYTDTTTELGQYGYKSLDEDGNSTFDLGNVGDIIPLTLSEDFWKGISSDGTYGENDLLKESHDYSLANNFYVWGDPQTFKSRIEDESVTNSTGVFTGGVTSWASTSGSGWNGMGFATTVERDLSMIDDTYYLHFSVRSDAAVAHVPVRFRLGSEDADAIITLGSYSTAPIIGDFKRDGEWYSFDIPVSVLKRYGKLWSKATDGKLAANEYLLCINTMSTYYTGSYFSFDNVFFWNKKDGSTPDIDGNDGLGQYTTKSLDADGKSYFDFAGKDYVIVNVGTAERKAMASEGDDRIIGDLSVNDQTTHLWLWEGTYTEGTQSGTVPNSFGHEGEGWIDLVVTDKGWTGAGLISDEGYDVSMLDNDWHLHFATRGTDSSNLNIIFGKAHFTIGTEALVENGEIYPVLGNFKRDGEWYSFDIPMQEFRNLCTDLFPAANGGATAYKDNLFVFKNGNRKGDELQIDNMFFWRNHQQPTMVDQLPLSDTAVKRAAAVYDLQGRRVADVDDVKSGRTSLRKGIYIINGKKVVL